MTLCRNASDFIPLTMIPLTELAVGNATGRTDGSRRNQMSAKLNASAALRSSGALPENVNYAVKSSYLLSFLESVPEVASKLKEPAVKDKKFEDVVKEAEQAAVLVLVY